MVAPPKQAGEEARAAATVQPLLLENPNSPGRAWSAEEQDQQPLE